MVISVVYLLVRCLLGCLAVLSQGQVSKEAELLAAVDGRPGRQRLV